MSGLLGALAAATRALEAQQFGLEVTGHNIANINTPGYTRRVAALSAVPPAVPGNAGGGVEVDGVRAVRDVLLERRLRDETSIEQRHAAAADTLSQVESVIGLPGQSLDLDMERFFDAYARLAEDPTSSPIRQEVIQEGAALADAFRAMAGRLDDTRRDADRHVRNEVEEVNALTARIAELNGAMTRASASQEPHDERDQAIETIRELAEHLDIVALERSGGRAFDVYFANGRPLVVGLDSYTLTTVNAPVSGLADIEFQGVTVTNEVTDGRIGGQLRARDVLIPNYASRLDELAFAVVQQVNALHDPGFDLNGNDAGDFFTPLPAQAGAAAAITIDPTLAGDPRLIAAAATPVAGDNQVARDIAALRDQRVLDTGTATFNDVWADVSFRVGRDAETETRQLESRGDTVRQIASLRDAISGVSLNEEALHLMRFQRAYEANAAMFRTINEVLDTLLQTVGA